MTCRGGQQAARCIFKAPFACEGGGPQGRGSSFCALCHPDAAPNSELRKTFRNPANLRANPCFSFGTPGFPDI